MKHSGIDPSALPKTYQDQIAAQYPVPKCGLLAADTLTGEKPRLRQRESPLNKTEQAFLAWLGLKCPLGTHIAQGITLKLANGVRYTPDFFTISRDIPIGCRMTAWEVKGHMRDDAAVKLKVAAKEYPWIMFNLVTMDRKHMQPTYPWHIQPILP